MRINAIEVTHDMQELMIKMIDIKGCVVSRSELHV